MPAEPGGTRVAQLSTRYPPGQGGVERHVEEISKRLATREYSIDVYTSRLLWEYPWVRLPPAVPSFERMDGVTIHRLPVWSLPGELHYPFFRGLERALEAGRPDLLHAHTYGTHHATVARRYHRRTGAPFVLSAHFHPIWSIEGGWVRHAIRGFYDRRLAGSIVADSAAVIVQTKEEERLLRIPGFPLPRVVTIPPGYTPLPAPREGSPTFAERFRISGPFLLFVGRLASNKGLFPLVRAFQSLARRDPTALLVLVGEDGGQRARLESLITETGLSPRVIFTGFVPDDALLASAFREARLTVLPSEYEAFGLVLLESLAEGTAVVASRVGGIPEFIEEGKSGLLVPPNDPEALADAIVSLWDDAERCDRMGAYGQVEVVPRYSWDRVVASLDNLYREVLNR